MWKKPSFSGLENILSRFASQFYLRIKEYESHFRRETLNENELFKELTN